MNLSFLLIAALVLPMAPAAGAEDEVTKKLRDDDVNQRLRAVDRLGEREVEGDEELLLEALKDNDWQVVERVCVALGRRGKSKETIRALAELAITARARPIRLAAAAALSTAGAEEGTSFIIKAVRSKDKVAAARAAEALGEVRHPSAKSTLLGALGSRDAKSGELRRQAAAALGSLGDPSVIPELEKRFLDPDIGARAGAIEGLARMNDFAVVAPLVSLLQTKDLSDLIERRAIHALRRVFFRMRDHEDMERGRRKVIGAFRNEKDPIAAARLARALASLGRAVPPQRSKEEGDEDEDTAEDAEANAPIPTGPSALEGTGPIGDPIPIVRVLVESGLEHPGM
ncbi:MAG: HEAT repeat domain-containing protein, partial [Planctomycetota bacterium]